MRALTLIAMLSLFLLTSITVAAAQTTPLCPPKALLSIARAGAACANLEAGSACYGSGSVTGIGLVQLGDHVSLRDLTSVSVGHTGDDTISIAVAAIRTSPRATDVLTVLLINESTLISNASPPEEQVMQATGTAHIRVAPIANADIIADLSVNNGVTANGRYGEWLRVAVPATGETGWVAASLLSGNTNRLVEVEPGAVVVYPFADFRFNLGAMTACGGNLPEGVLLQTPSTDLKDAAVVTFDVYYPLRLAGTAFVAIVGDARVFLVLDGAAELDGQIIPAGAVSRYREGEVEPPTPYDPSLTVALPVNNLPRRFQIVPPQTQAAIDAQIAALLASPPTPVIIPPTPLNVCRRTIGRNADLMSGPGEDYEALGQIEAGTPITPQLAATDPRGGVWWQLPSSAWVAHTDVVERGDCAGQVVPVTGRVEAPRTNTYSLELCQSSNGPVRSGQYVTFEFIPPAWDNLGEATAAIRTDPGHFTINANRYYANASEPFRLGENVNTLEDRYLRRFTLQWQAEPGTFRITGDWLSYEPSCNLTVIVE